MLHPLASSVAWFIRSQRDQFAPQGVPICDTLRATLVGYFRPELLASVRLVEIGVGDHIKFPLAYSVARRLASTKLLPTVEWAAITFDNVIVSHEVPAAHLGGGLLFHELVHVEQYRQLGVRRFAELYVRGFLRGRGYDGIPLERNAHQLTERYALQRGSAFCVENEVKSWIEGDRF